MLRIIQILTLKSYRISLSVNSVIIYFITIFRASSNRNGQKNRKIGIRAPKK